MCFIKEQILTFNPTFYFLFYFIYFLTALCDVALLDILVFFIYSSAYLLMRRRERL